MKRALPILLSVCLLAVPALAGDIPIPPLPPPCTENCTNSTASTSTSTIPYELLVLLLTKLARP